MVRLGKENNNELSIDSKLTSLQIQKSSEVVYYEIDTKITKRKKDCVINGNPKHMICVNEFIDSKLNCTPTWRQKRTSRKFCNVSEEKQYLRYFFDYQRQNLPEADYCRVPNCKEVDWTLRPFFTMSKEYVTKLFNQGSNENNTIFGIRFTSPQVIFVIINFQW